MKISFVSIETAIQAIGFRKMASLVRSIHPQTEVCYIPVPNQFSYTRVFQKSGEVDFSFSEGDINSIGEHLARTDMVCFSSMSMFAKLTKDVINKIRAINKATYIVWGGIHPIVHPEDAIQNADAICVGEGETAFKNFLSAFKKGTDYSKTGNFWFNVNGNIIRNNFLPLHSDDDMNKFPLPLYAEEELFFERGTGFVPLDISKYLSQNSLIYNSIWSIGCPYKCIYCSNSKFIENDSDYRKIRHTSVDYIIFEVKSVLKKHPHISVVVFHDDSFMAISVEILKEFSERWKSEIGLPFCVLGVIPSFVQRDKLSLLVSAGMNRMRMGIQSGSDRILKFYRRPNKPGLIHQAVTTINEFSDYMVPPGYDIIVDNPIETREEIIETLDLLYNLPRPYMLNIFTLRVIPNTELAQEFSKLGILHPGIESTDFTSITPTISNVMIYMLTVFKPPIGVYNFLLKYVRESSRQQPKYPLALHFFRLISLFKIVLSRMRFMEFPGLPGKINFLIWKLGITGYWQARHRKNISKTLTSAPGYKNITKLEERVGH